MTTAAPPGSQAVDRAAALLDLVVTADEPQTFSSLVDELELARSTTSRLLGALERNRLVQRDRNGSYRAGALFALYAARQTAVQDLAELVQPVLDRVAEESGETATFGVPRGEQVVQAGQADGRYLLGATNWEGLHVPAHCSAQGKVLMAFGQIPLPSGPLESRTPATITTRAALMEDLAEIRRRGWGCTWEELEAGLVAVGAPVRGSSGVVVGAISVSGPTARIPRERLRALSQLVVVQAAAVSTQLGFPRKAGAA